MLVDRHKRLVFNVALRMLRNREDAEDAAQEAFLRAFRSIGTFRGQARRNLAMGRFADWTEGWKQRVHAGLESIGHVGERPWFLPFALIVLIGFALYQFLSLLYEDRRPRIVGR